MARYVVVWFETVGGEHRVNAEGANNVLEAMRRAEELGGIWFPASEAEEVIQKIKEAVNE